MFDPGVFFSQVFELAGMVSVIGGGILMLIKLFTPWKKIRKDVDKNTENLRKDFDKLKEIQEVNVMFAKSLVAIMNNLITGNSIDKLKEVRDELNNHLIEH